ncbi:MAG: serine/threonine-protein kinase PknK, partial [Deltaproteobacteria bacterium]|nr:serine/threonine-protein kinase PknK [Deltaproteobacteria bacterium]
MNTPRLIDGRYRVLAELGSGISGEVFKVEGPEGVSALKLLRHEIEGLADEERITTFKFEFSLLKGLQHPNIVRIHDFGYDEVLRRFYFTQEWIEGESLARLGANADLKTLENLVIQALQGLSYLHAHDVLHGDLKPENLLVTAGPEKSSQLKIIDFGISHPSVAASGGTAPYLAPEKILKEAADGRSDLYSLAVVFYSLLTGENPFLRKNLFATLGAHLHFVPPPATVLRKEIDPVWSSLLDRMLAKNPRQRIASAEDCLKFLETEGEVPIAAARPKALAELFVGREELVQKAKAFLDQRKTGGPPRALLLVGEKGLGKSLLLRELKYEAELREIEALGPEENPRRPPSLRFFSREEFSHRNSREKSSVEEGAPSLVAALNPEHEEVALRNLAPLQPEVLRLRPLTLAETEKYLRETTRNAKIPEPLLRGLFQFSRGYPGPLREALQSLLKDPLIVDSSGKWNLAVFREAAPELERLHIAEDTLAHALEGEMGVDPREHWRLELRRAEAIARESRLDPALSLLTRLETELAKTFERPERLLERARLLEARGWIYTKQARFQEAREDFASSLSLLNECESAPPGLELRLKNFVAF